MDRRTKFILFILLAIVLFGLVGWFIVWPTIRPLLPDNQAQPPAIPPQSPPTIQTTPPAEQQTEQPTESGLATFEPVSSADAAIIAELERRAGVLAERVESGSSEDGFRNFDDAQLGVSPTLASHFASMKTAMQAEHPAAGGSYVTVARRLVERGESDEISGSTFNVTVQLQIQTRQDGNTWTSYREATVTFTNTGGETWIASRYESAEFTP